MPRTPILFASRSRLLPPPAIAPLPAPSPPPSAPALVPALLCSGNLPRRATRPCACLAVVQGTAGPTGVVMIVADPEEAGFAQRREGLTTKRAPWFPFIQPSEAPCGRKRQWGRGAFKWGGRGEGCGGWGREEAVTPVAFFRTKEKGASGSKENREEPLLVLFAVRYYFRWQGLLLFVDPGCR